MIRFSIDSHFLAEVVEIGFEVLQILIIVYSNVLAKINPTFFMAACFFLPIVYI